MKKITRVEVFENSYPVMTERLINVVDLKAQEQLMADTQNCVDALREYVAKLGATPVASVPAVRQLMRLYPVDSEKDL